MDLLHVFFIYSLLALLFICATSGRGNCAPALVHLSLTENELNSRMYSNPNIAEIAAAAAVAKVVKSSNKLVAKVVESSNKQ